MLRINVWISHHHGSINTSQIPTEFPYDAKLFTGNRKKTYYSLDDIYSELIAIFDKDYGREGLGELLWIQGQSICNLGNLVDEGAQKRIIEYRFATEFRTPPYPSLNEAPAQLITDFFIIKEEMNFMKQQKEKSNGK